MRNFTFRQQSQSKCSNFVFISYIFIMPSLTSKHERKVTLFVPESRFAIRFLPSCSSHQRRCRPSLNDIRHTLAKPNAWLRLQHLTVTITAKDENDTKLKYVERNSKLKVVWSQNITKLDGKYSERVQIPAKAFLSPTLGNTCHTYYFAAR